MNLLARILSHGFALVVVVLIAITLMYRGDLFPEWGLPDFLVIKDKSGAGTNAASGTVDRVLPATVATSQEATTGVSLEAPQVEVIEEIMIQDAVPPPVELVPDTVDESPEISPAAAEEAEPAVPEAMLAEPVEAAPTVTVTESEVVTEQLEAPLADVAPSMPAAEPVTDPQPEPVAAEAAATVTESEVITEQLEAPLTDVAPSMPAAEPDTDPEPVAVEAPATVTEIEVVTEQLETPLADVAPSMPAAEPVTEPEPVAVEAPATVTESVVVTERIELPLADMAPSIPAAEPVTDPQPESVTAAATLLERTAGKSTYELLAAAREAYWLHDYEGAENHYRLLIQLEPDNSDWYGELGNMYFSQGQWQQASAVYYEAGVRLLKDGKVLQARQMVDVIRGLNGVEVDDLENQVNASQDAP